MKKLFLALVCTIILETAVQGDEPFWLNGVLLVSGDFLDWKSKEKGLGYTTNPDPLNTTTNFAQGQLVLPTFDWEAAFRLKADYMFSDSFWTAGLQYTQYFGKAHGTQIAGNEEGIFPTLSFSSDTLATDYVTSAKESWRLHTSLLDCTAGYEWCLQENFPLIFTLSIRNAWITQDIHATYFGGMFSAGQDDISLHSTFYGIGPRLGITPNFYLGYGFSIYAEAAASLLYGWYNAHQSEMFLQELPTTLHKQPQNWCWNGDLIAGLCWTYFPEECLTIKEYFIDIGFDYLYFSRQYVFQNGPEFSLESQGDSIQLYGLHASAGIKF